MFKDCSATLFCEKRRCWKRTRLPLAQPLRTPHPCCLTHCERRRVGSERERSERNRGLCDEHATPGCLSSPKLFDHHCSYTLLSFFFSPQSATVFIVVIFTYFFFGLKSRLNYIPHAQRVRRKKAINFFFRKEITRGGRRRRSRQTVDKHNEIVELLPAMTETRQKRKENSKEGKGTGKAKKKNQARAQTHTVRHTRARHAAAVALEEDQPQREQQRNEREQEEVGLSTRHLIPLFLFCFCLRYLPSVTALLFSFSFLKSP